MLDGSPCAAVVSRGLGVELEHPESIAAISCSAWGQKLEHLLAGNSDFEVMIVRHLCLRRHNSRRFCVARGNMRTDRKSKINVGASVSSLGRLSPG